MMKIQIHEIGNQTVLQIEGRLAGAYVPELETCWRTACASHPGRRISVDLKSVTCVDRTGRSLLRSMHDAGVIFIHAGLAMQDILEQIAATHDCDKETNKEWTDNRRNLANDFVY